MRVSQVGYVGISNALGIEGGGTIAAVGAGGKTSLIFSLAKELAQGGSKVLVTTTTKMIRPQPHEVQVVLLSPDVRNIMEEARFLGREGKVIFAASCQDEDPKKLKGFAPNEVEAISISGLFDWILVEADGASGKPLKAPAGHEPVVPNSSKWVVALVGLDVLGKPLGPQWVFRWEICQRILDIQPGSLLRPVDVARLACHPEGLFKGSPVGSCKVLWLNKGDLPGAEESGLEIIRLIESEKVMNPQRVVIGALKSGNRILEVRELSSPPEGGGNEGSLY